MTGIALAVALVLVALIARDVVLRVMEKRLRAADVAQVAAALDGETQRLSETRVAVDSLRSGNDTQHAELGRLIDAARAEARADLAGLAEKVEGLVMRSTMGGKR